MTIAFGRWDTHGDNFSTNAAAASPCSTWPSRPWSRTCTAAGWTRTSRSSSGASSAARRKINKDAGRDHWPPVNFALLAGGGMRTGQVIGSTDRCGGYAKDRPVTFQNVFATLYHNLGIDPATTVPDRSGRPMSLLDERSRSRR